MVVRSSRFRLTGRLDAASPEFRDTLGQRGRLGPQAGRRRGSLLHHGCILLSDLVHLIDCNVDLVKPAGLFL